MEVMGLAIDQGRVSVRRMAALLDVAVEGLAELFAAHGFERPVELQIQTPWRGTPARCWSTRISSVGPQERAELAIWTQDIALDPGD